MTEREIFTFDDSAIITVKGFYKESSEPNSKGSPLICNTGFLYTQKRVMMCYQQLI